MDSAAAISLTPADLLALFLEYGFQYGPPPPAVGSGRQAYPNHGFQYWPHPPPALPTGHAFDYFSAAAAAPPFARRSEFAEPIPV